MTLSPAAVLVIFGLGALLGLWLRGLWRGKKTRFVRVPWPTVTIRRRASQEMPVTVPVPMESGGRLPPERDLGWHRTAIYLFRGNYNGRSNVLLYVGIAIDPQKRAKEHAGWGDEPMKTWYPDIKSVESHWCWCRYAALAIEWALIKFLKPPHNTAPSGPDDHRCAHDRPNFKQVHVTLPRPNWANTKREAVGR